jgi:hypothetical protein
LLPRKPKISWHWWFVSRCKVLVIKHASFYHHVEFVVIAPAVHIPKNGKLQTGYIGKRGSSTNICF